MNLIIDYLNSAKNKVVEVFDPENKKIKYTDKIKQNREIKKISGDEEIVRAYLLTKLVNELGYNPENIEIEKEYDIGRPKVNKPRIDIIVKDEHENPFLFIELKAPGNHVYNLYYF